MSLPRFYSVGARFAIGEKVALSDKARQHAGRALRIEAGKNIILFNELGECATGPIAYEKESAFITVSAIEKPKTDSPLNITLIQALVSNEKLDFVAEKAVEIGVSNLILVPMERSIAKLTEEKKEKRLTHLTNIMVSACEQSGKNRIPTLAFLSFEKALLTTKADARYLLAPSAVKTPRLTNLASVAFVVGPEGGIADAEIQKAADLGWEAVQLGPRVLRTETAGLVAATLANAASGDLKFS